MKKTTFLLAALMCGAWCATAQTTENGHEYVDLGLSVKWATCNVGATKPEEYGNYYAWGETTTKGTYNWSTYKWATATYNAANDDWVLKNLTKYNTSSDYGTVDNKTVLELADDAARANWGGAWRMPTDEEWTELRENCTWTWTENYKEMGIKGLEVKSKINGNSIFLPAAGFRSSDFKGVSLAGYYGDGWSSSLSTDYPEFAWLVYFSYLDKGGNSGCNVRYCGRSVRPVLE